MCVLPNIDIINALTPKDDNFSMRLCRNKTTIENIPTKPICATPVADIGNGRSPLWNPLIPKSESTVAQTSNAGFINTIGWGILE